MLQDGATFLPLPQSEAEVLSSTQRTNSSSASGQESVAGDTSTCSPHQGLTSTSTPHQGSSSLPNWAEFFPPPPACPPSDLESSANTPLIARNQHKVASQPVSYTNLTINKELTFCCSSKQTCLVLETINYVGNFYSFSFSLDCLDMEL